MKTTYISDAGLLLKEILRGLFSGKEFSQEGLFRKLGISAVLLLVFSTAFAQEDAGRAAKEARKYLQEAQEALEEEDLESAEAYYRQAIAKDPSNAEARYNMGNLYHEFEKPADAVDRHAQAAEIAEEKPLKHRSFHNQGNAYMAQNKYPEAIDAYKNALRNDPTDDETRYNLALAKQKWEEEKESGGGDDQQDQEGENQDQDSENQNQEGEQGQEQQSDQGDPQDSENQDQQNQGEQESEGQEGEEGQPQDQQDQGEGQDTEEQEGQPQQQQPVPGQLSPQQIQNLLEAMGNEERKVQDKINAQKAKGAKTDSEKDW